MKSFLKFAAIGLLTGILINISCKKEYSCKDCATRNNKLPIAVAGPDQVITLPTDSILLYGSSSSDPDGMISNYLWTKISGPVSFNILKPTDSITEVKTLVAGAYLFELKVTDNEGLSAKDTMQVLVENTIEATCPFQKTLIGTISPYRYAFKTATAGNKIVFAAGFEIDDNVGSVASTKVNIFDMATQTWSGADLTGHGGHVATIAAADKIFFAGGTAMNGGTSGIASSRVDIYNTTDNTWTTAELSEARSGVTAVRAGDKILFAGGGPSASTKVDVYDISSSSWSVADVQHPIYGATALGNTAIIEAYTLFNIYDASSNSWSAYPAGGNYYNMSSAALGNKIYLAGGYDGNNFSNLVHVYDVISNSWSSITLSRPKAGITSIGAGDKIFWAGGFDSVWYDGAQDYDYVRNLNDVEIYDVTTGIYSHYYMSRGISDCLGVANDHVVFRAPDGLHIYNVNSGTWSICNSDMDWSPQAISIGNGIYVAGPVGAQTANLTVWKLEF